MMMMKEMTKMSGGGKGGEVSCVLAWAVGVGHDYGYGFVGKGSILSLGATDKKQVHLYVCSGK